MSPTLLRHTACAALALLCLLTSAQALADKKASGKNDKKDKGNHETTLPIQIGVGPSFYFLTGPLQEDQLPHYGLHLYAKAIVEGENLTKAKKKAPKKYKKYLRGSEGFRIGHLLVPDALIISPQTNNTGIYGATWRPLALDLPLLSGGPRLTLGAGLMLTYAYIHTELDAQEQLDNPNLFEGDTHFLRPGVDLRAELEVPLGETLLFSLGWSSAAYIPQELGKGIFEIGDFERSAWHFGQAYALLNFRIPYKTKL